MTEEIKAGEFIVYSGDDGRLRVQVRLQDGTVWLTQQLMADLYGVSVKTISEHLLGVFDDAEVERQATVRSFRIVRTEGERSVSRELEHYSLPAILAVGYRVRSTRGTQFRQWATARLTEYVTIAKNYLDAPELEALNRIVSAYLEFAELQAMNRRPMTMAAWIAKLDEFLKLSDRGTLANAGSVSHDDAVGRAEAEYARFARERAALPAPIDRDFEGAVRSTDVLAKARRVSARPKK